MPEPVPVPETREQLFSECVGLANAEQGIRPPFMPYQFSNGRQFRDAQGAYDQPRPIE